MRKPAERHAIDAFLGALERPLATEVQKLGCRTLEKVVAAARRIEKVLEEQTDSKMERLITAMQDQIRLLKKDLKDAHAQISASATPTACTRRLARHHSSCRSSASSRPATLAGCRSAASAGCRPTASASHRSATPIPACPPPVPGLCG